MNHFSIGETRSTLYRKNGSLVMVFEGVPKMVFKDGNLQLIIDIYPEDLDKFTKILENEGINKN